MPVTETPKAGSEMPGTRVDFDVRLQIRALRIVNCEVEDNSSAFRIIALLRVYVLLPPWVRFRVGCCGWRCCKKLSATLRLALDQFWHLDTGIDWTLSLVSPKSSSLAAAISCRQLQMVGETVAMFVYIFMCAVALDPTL